MPQPHLKPLTSEDKPREIKSEFFSSGASEKYKPSAESHKKIKDWEMSLNRVPKANEAFCLDMYKHTAGPSMPEKKHDLFSGLNQTVKVSELKQ